MTNIETNKIALFDMDGTLFNYEYQMRESLSWLKSPSEPNPYEINVWDEEKYPWLTERMELIKKVPGWWANLPILKIGWDVYHIAKKIGFDIHTLTKGPSSKPHAWAEKVECLRARFIEGDVTIHITEDKSVHYGRVLVDDYPKYIEGWLKHRCRGLVIMPVNDNNKDFRHENVIPAIPYNEENLEEIRIALQAAFDRSPKEHWKDMLK